MSRLVEFNGTTVVQIAPAAKRLPPNPIFLERIPGPNTLAPSNRSTLTSVEPHWEDKGFRNNLLVKDRRSFLTGSAPADLQGCHLINTIRGSTADKVKIKNDIEKYLSELSIIGTAIGFRLDSVSNGILLQSSLHCNLDLHAAIAILPTKDFLESILESLKASNLQWDTIIKQGFATFARPGFQPPTKAVRWQVVVLHPDAVCPEGSPIAILANPSLEKVANPVWVNHSAVRFTLCDSNDQPRIFIHGDPGGECLIPVLPTTRLEYESVSVMAAVINANAKFQHAIGNSYPGTTDENILTLADLCHKIVAEFFTHPRRSSPIQQSEPDFKDEGLLSGDGDEFNSSTPTWFDAEGDVRMGHLSTFTHPGPQDASDADVVEPPEEPDEKGLTRSEYKILMQKVGDPDLGANEKVQVATMMLFGPRPYQVPEFVIGESLPKASLQL